MKTILTTSAAVLAIACASGPEERSPSAEQRERIAEQRAEQQRAEQQRAEQQRVELGSEPIPSQFDRDGDGLVENVELRQAGVSQGAIDRLDDKEDVARDGDDSRPQATDAEITHRIREKLAARDDLSAKAKSVQISTTNGKVRLSGPVESPDEKAKVESCARDVAGADDVDNRIAVPR